MSDIKTIEIQPLTGLMDTRSTPDEVPFGGWRMLQNMDITQKNRLCRSAGWSRLLRDETANNFDLHDQLLSLAGGGVREPVTFGFEAVSTSGYNKLLVGTPHRLYTLNNSTGNFHIISDQLGESIAGTCSDFGWEAAQNGNIVALTNGVDRPVYWVYEQPPLGVDNQSASEFSDLVKIRLASAKVVVEWKGLLIFANVVMNGVRRSDRLVWSDVNRPTSFVENLGISAAGKQDLGGQESILRCVPVADSLLIFTTRGIWEAFLTGDVNTVLDFRRRYNGTHSGHRCLAYRRAIVSDGDQVYYLGREGIYRYDLYTPAPERVEGMHRVSNLIFDGLDSANCNQHVAGYDVLTKNLWFSWATAGSACPNKTLRFNLEYGFHSFIDHGFNFFLNYNPDKPKTLREWLIENGLCTAADLVTLGLGFVKEGQFCVTPPVVSAPSPPANIYTSESMTIEGVEVEDWTQAEADVDSLCTRLGDGSILDTCSAEIAADECDAGRMFIAGSATDFSIKQIGGVYHRERATAFTPCATYVLDGYESIMRSGPNSFKKQSVLKQIHRILIETYAEDQTVPSDLKLRIAAAYQAADPNTDNCSLLWVEPAALKLRCGSQKSNAQHQTDGTRQGFALEWPLYEEGRFLYWEFVIDGTGGAACFSRIEVDIMAEGGF